MTKIFPAVAEKLAGVRGFPFIPLVLQVELCCLLKSRGCYSLPSPYKALFTLRMPELLQQPQGVTRFDSFCLELLLISQLFVSNSFH